LIFSQIEACLFNESSGLAAALGVAKFLTLIAMNLVKRFVQHKSDFSSQQTHLLNNLCGGFAKQNILNLLSPEAAAKLEPLSTYKRRYFLRKTFDKNPVKRVPKYN
jgi:hypothetical protein